MKITLLLVGKTNDDYIRKGMDNYLKRMKRYISFTVETIPALKNAKSLSKEQVKEKEGLLILSKISEHDFLLLLDENGKEMSSVEFSNYLKKMMLQSVKNLVFVIGGAYGFSPQVYARGNSKLSISQMTFSHQIIRLIFMEQIYRAFTIINNEPYHHE
jgi:23S rRNA (pseudouridine1915-N3)-methyltransferase